MFRILCIVLIAGSFDLSASANDASTFYTALESKDSVVLNKELSALEKSFIKQKDAYTGTLLMKKSDIVKRSLDKLSLFKKGKKLLEAAIKSDSLNAEYRFLRLTIQENCPDFLKYYSKKEEDAESVKNGFHSLQPEVQQAIRNYSKTSHVLKPEDFQK